MDFWETFKAGVQDTFNLILDMDNRSLVVVREGFELVWQDIRSYFAE